MWWVCEWPKAWRRSWRWSKSRPSTVTSRRRCYDGEWRHWFCDGASRRRLCDDASRRRVCDGASRFLVCDGAWRHWFCDGESRHRCSAAMNFCLPWKQIYKNWKIEKNFIFFIFLLISKSNTTCTYVDVFCLWYIVWALLNYC